MDTDMTTLSIKKSSTADVEAAIAQALQQLTGWDRCTVTVQAVEFDDRVVQGARIALRLQAVLGSKPDAEIPFTAT